jgi:hypothetical protein
LPIAQPAKVATPATAAFGFAVQVNVAPAGVVIAKVIDVVAVVVNPLASWIATTGWLAKTAELTLFEGLIMNTSWVAVPNTVNEALVALVSPGDVALSVNDPA